MQIVPATALLEISRNYVDHRSHREDCWYWYSDEGRGGAIPLSISTLYRGQNARHAPMLTTITRGLQSTDIVNIFEASISDQAKIAIRLAQSWWFGRELTRHPISHHAASQNLDLNEIALAQHYGIPTGYLDLTDDFNVSAFFATCRENVDGWRPISSGVGVIYRVKLRNIENPFDDYIPLGPQKLPRPSEQCAWVVELPLRHGFEGWPGVEMLQFHHDHRVGQHFLEMFEGGKQLFPHDPLADVAEEILACGEIPADLVEAALKSFTTDPCGMRLSDLPAVRNEISTLIHQTSYRQLLTDQHVASLLTDQEWIEKMLATVKARAIAVRRVQIQQDEADSNHDTTY